MDIAEENADNYVEDENEMNLINTSKVITKNKILDADSKIEGISSEKVSEREKTDYERVEDSNSSCNSNEIKKSKRLAILDTDSEDDTIHEQDTDSNSKNNLESPNLGDSGYRNPNGSYAEDVVDEEDVTPHNKSFPDEETAVETVIYATNNKGELIKENAALKSASLSVLCDPESEEEAENIIEGSFDNVVVPTIYKKLRKKKGEEKPQRMTVQEAAKQRSEIRSESQRMLRESNISLPYHKPKTYTITEFLQKRSKLSSTLAALPKAPPSVAIKMSKDQLKEVSRKLDERIKEVEEFYKSDSEEDEEDDPDKEIQSWIYDLVDNAVNIVEGRNEEVLPENMEIETPIEEKPSEVSKDPTDYEFALDDISELEDTRKGALSELIKDKLTVQPKLSGTPDDIIDLEEGVTKVKAVKQLVEKLLQHTVKKTHHKHKVQLNVVAVVATGKVIEETVSMNVDDEEEEPTLVETPGAKLKRLREELQVQIAQKRMELWKQKQEQGDILTTENKKIEEEKTEKDILNDEEEEFEVTESESEEDDEEEEYEKLEKRKTKSAFINEEADEDDEFAEDEEEDMECDAGVEDVNDDTIDVNKENVDKTPPSEQSLKKKVLKRIIKPFSVDSDDEDDQSPVKESVLKYYSNEDDDFLPPNLPKEGTTPQRPHIEKNESEIEFLTPITYLTGIQNLNTSTKFLNSPNSPQILSNPFGSQDSNFQSQVQKNLFPESKEEATESQNTQENLEELAQLCSGKFPETQIERKTQEKEIVQSQELPSTQDLLNLCSGDFPTMTGCTKPEEETNPSNSSTQKPAPKISKPEHINEEIKNLDEEQDQIISQLLDEDDLERFKKKFESPLATSVRKSQISFDAEEVNATGLINSDEENEELEVKQKKRKKLVFSDDEEGINDENVEDEESELEEEQEEEIDLQATDDEEQQLENEIKEQESKGYNLNDFLEKEAELSESEWGSADEDEKDLDELEVELGDQEKFNEKKIRNELERIHMRQLLDDDNREVKLLQELLLEDGEMHGTGRKRQFRWKTLDLANNGEFEKRNDDDIFLDDEESEEHWRKMRHKREMFLKKKLSSNDSQDDDCILTDSEILKLGQKVVKTKSFLSQNNTPTEKTEEDSKEPFNLLAKRGSFLTRRDQVLQRLAEFNKVTDAMGSTVVKNSRSFVFQTVGPNGPVNKDNNKRKATESTPNVIKKLRLDDLSPAAGKNVKSSKPKKLFGNW